MPSHIYLRTGNYLKGVAVNEAAVLDYQQMISKYEPVTGNAFLYIIHNLHMQTNHAMLAGQSARSSLSAKATVNSIPSDYLLAPAPLGNAVQYIYMTPVLVDIRFGNWGQLLANEKPSETQVYSNVLYHFGRGMALSNQSSFPEAKNELAAMRELMKDSSLAIPFSPFSSALEGAIVAENILAGTIALKQKRYDDAITLFQKAVDTEEHMVYNEPRDWLLNPKHYLGNAYIAAGRFDDAIKTFEVDLLNNKENGWALFGLWQAMTAKKDVQGATKMLTRFRKAFEKSDVKLYGAVF
jgi:tetratricopeptide (TPR) repeat protein